VSVFRPAVRLRAPDGRDWELYCYRIQLPNRRREELGFDPDLPNARGQIVGALLDGVFWLVGRVLRLLELLLWDVPRAALQAFRSDEWTIEAITWQPHRTSYTWRTTGEFRGNVLAQVEGQLARGERPHARHATFVGAQG
jgi:hypothetical protein